MKNNLYNDNSIESLSPRDFTRLRPGVYYGSTEYSTQLLVEIVSNAVDEYNLGHGDTINVDYKDDGSCRVEDFGQGFPVNVLREDGETVLQASFDVLNTSGKFSDKGVYEGTALGLNGIGSKLTNYLSNWLDVYTYRDGKSEHIHFIEGIFDKRELKEQGKFHTGTIIEWKPSEEFFANTQIDIEKIKKLFPDDIELHKKLERTKDEFEKKQSKQIDAYERNKFQRRNNLKRHKSSERIKLEKSNNYNSIVNNKTNINNNINKLTNNDIKINKKKRKRPKTANNKKNRNENIINDMPEISEKEILNENKIKFMVKDYKEKLMKDFLDFVNKEKESENERKELMLEAKSEKERKRLERIFAMQRGQSTDKIGEYNKLIDEKLEIYEKELKKLYDKQNNKI